MSLQDTRELFEFLQTALKQKKTKIHFGKDHIKLISNAVYNLFFNDSIELQESQQRDLNKHLLTLKRLASKESTIVQKRKLLIKHKKLLKLVVDIVLNYINSEV